MLLITRRPEESIVINGSIEVKVVEVKGTRVKLGVQYPEGNTVYRKELWLKIQEENQQAAVLGDGAQIDRVLDMFRQQKAAEQQKDE